MDDDELIARVAAGDDVALRELFFRHAPWLAARLRTALPAGDEEDVLQETFLAVWRGAKGYHAGNAGGWLWGIARRQAAMWLRRRRNTEELMAALARMEDPAQDDPAESAAQRLDLAVAVESLGPAGSPEREVWRLLYAEDRPVSAVAELLRVPEGTVKSRAHRVRRLLQAALSGRTAAQEGGS